jgi:small subunit ribosomal protein S2
MFMNTESTPKNSTVGTLITRLFAAGAHFGFTKSRRHPSVAPFIFGNKQGTDIIDLEQSARALEVACSIVSAAGAAGKTVLFVSTKEEIAPTVKKAALQIGMPYVVNRWIGGILTNWPEIKKRLARYADLIAQGESGELERKYTKKERVVIGRELDKLAFNFDGIKTLTGLPHLLVVVDPRHDAIAVTEARDVKIPVIGITSSDADLRALTYPVVVNDALQSSVDVVLAELVAAYEAGKTAAATRTDASA